MASYDLAGSRVRFINSAKSAYTQYRARADITTTDYPTYVTITVSPGFVYGKQKYGPQVTAVNTSFTVSATSTTSRANSCNFTTSAYGTAQSSTTLTPVTAFSYNVSKGTSAKNETISIVFRGTVGADGTVTIENTNDYSTGTGTSGSATSQGSISISIPALASYAITYNANGGSGAPSGQTKYYGININLQSGVPTRSRYKFMGWSTSSTATSASYSAGQLYTANAPLTLYAVWHQNPYISKRTVTSSAPYYKGLTPYTINISSAQATDGASFSVISKIGSQTSNGITAASGNLTLTPQTTGTFTPYIIIIDSLGASTTYSLPNITVKQYVAPSVVVSAERTKSDGTIAEDSTANCGLITATFTIPSKDGYPLTDAPTIKLTRSDGNIINSPSVTWYTNRNDSTKIVNTTYNSWSTMESGTTVYGIISGCDPSYSYQVSITPKDGNTGATKVAKTTIVPPLFYTIDFLAGGKGIAFGASATEEGFYCNMDITLTQDILLELDGGITDSIDAKLLTAISNLGWDTGTDSVIVN